MRMESSQRSPLERDHETSTLTQDNLLLLDREALRASVKARYDSTHGACSSELPAGGASMDQVSAGADEGRYSNACTDGHGTPRVQPRPPPPPPQGPKPPGQRRIKSAAPRIPSSNASSSQLSQRLEGRGSTATPCGHSLSADPRRKQRRGGRTPAGSSHDLSSSSSARLLSGSAVGSTVSVADINYDGDKEDAEYRASLTTRCNTAHSRKNLASASMQLGATTPVSRHMGAKPERPHSSYTRPSSAVQRTQMLLRRRSVSEPSQLHIDVDDHSRLFQREETSAGTTRQSQGQARPVGLHHPPAKPTAMRQRPHSAMPRLQATPRLSPQRPFSSLHKPVYRMRSNSGVEPTPSATDLSIQGKQLATPANHQWPGLLEEVDEEEIFQRELEEEEFALLMATDPMAAREQALQRALHIRKLETPERPPSASDWRRGGIERPEFHCDRCRDFWRRTGKLPDGCARNIRSISAFNWSRPKSSSRPKSKGTEESVAPVNSVVSVTGDGTGLGAILEDGSLNDGDTDGVRRTLSTIAGSEAGDALLLDMVGRGTLDGEHGTGSSGTELQGSGLGPDAAGDEHDRRSFIGADGKTYLPTDALADFKPQDIPAHTTDRKSKPSRAKSAARKKKPKRSKSARGRVDERKDGDPAHSGEDEDDQAGGIGGLSIVDLDKDSDAASSGEGSGSHVQDTGPTLERRGSHVPISDSMMAAAKPATAGKKTGKKKKGREPLKLENLQDMFTRAFTFTYYVPSKAHQDETTAWRNKSSK